MGAKKSGLSGNSIFEIFIFIQNGCKVRNNIDTQQLQEYNKLIFNNNCSDKGKIKIPD
jgi:hypothetical protein